MLYAVHLFRCSSCCSPAHALVYITALYCTSALSSEHVLWLSRRPAAATPSFSLKEQTTYPFLVPCRNITSVHTASPGHLQVHMHEPEKSKGPLSVAAHRCIGWSTCLLQLPAQSSCSEHQSWASRWQVGSDQSAGTRVCMFVHIILKFP